MTDLDTTLAAVRDRHATRQELRIGSGGTAYDQAARDVGVLLSGIEALQATNATYHQHLEERDTRLLALEAKVAMLRSQLKAADDRAQMRTDECNVAIRAHERVAEERDTFMVSNAALTTEVLQLRDERDAALRLNQNNLGLLEVLERIGVARDGLKTEIARLTALWEAEHATVMRLGAERDAFKAVVQMWVLALDGMTEPVPPVYWQPELAQSKQVLTGEMPRCRICDEPTPHVCMATTSPAPPEVKT